MLFAAEHLFIGSAPRDGRRPLFVVLATLLRTVWQYGVERGGNSIEVPAILHSELERSDLFILCLAQEFVVTAVCSHMGVVLVSLYLVLLSVRSVVSFDLLLALAAFVIGIVVGLTGMGGGALMTPMWCFFST